MKKSLFAFLSILIVLGLSLAYYFVANRSDRETPPTITISTAKYQGLIQGDTVCNLTIPMYEFTDAKVSSYVTPAADTNANWYNLTKGVHFYHSDADVTVKNILDNIKPVSGNKILIMHYPSADTNELKQFAAYPTITGQINLTTDSIIPANEGIIIFSCKDSKIYNIKDETTPGAALPATLTAKTKGWILLSAVTGNTLKNSLTPSKNKISSIWPAQLAGFDNDTFTKKFLSPDDANLPALDASGNFRMVWLKIGTPAADPVPSVNITLSADPNVNIVTPNTIYDFASLNLIVSPDKDVTVKKIEFKLVNTNPTKPTDLSDFSEIKFYNDGYIIDEKLYTLAFDAKSSGIGSLPLPPLGTTTLTKSSTAKVDIKVKTGAAIKPNNYKLEITKIEFDGNVSTNVTFPLVSAVKKVTPPIAATVTITVALPVATSDSITFDWTDENISGNVKKYLIYRSENTPVDTTKQNFPTATPPGNFLGGTTNKNFTDNKMALKPKTKYYYVIHGVDQLSGVNGNILGTSDIFNVTTPDGPAPAALAAPTEVTVTAITATTAKVSWTAPAGASGKTYSVTYKEGICPITATDNHKNDITTNNTILSGLSPAKDYRLTVKTTDATTFTASPESTCVPFKTAHAATAPAKPEKPLIDLVTSTSARVSWNSPVLVNETSGKLKITYKTGGCTAVTSPVDTILDAKDHPPINMTNDGYLVTKDGLTKSMNYGIYVSVSNDGSNYSENSDCTDFRTKSGPKPSTPIFYEITSSSVVVTWLSPLLTQPDDKYKIYYKKGGCNVSAYLYKEPSASSPNILKGLLYGYGYKLVNLTVSSIYGVEIEASEDGINWSEMSDCIEFSTSSALL